MTVAYVRSFELAATPDVRVAPGYFNDGGSNNYTYAFSPTTRRIISFNAATGDVHARSEELAETPMGGVLDAGGPTPTDFLWVNTAEGHLLEVNPRTLAVVATYGEETFGEKLTPLQFIGFRGFFYFPKDRCLYLQGRPGEVIAWNTGTKKVVAKSDTGLSQIISTINAQFLQGAHTGVSNSTIVTATSDGQTSIPLTDFPYGVGFPSSGDRDTKVWKNGGELHYGTDYTFNPVGTVLLLTSGADAGDVFKLAAFINEDVAICADGAGRVALLAFDIFRGFRAHRTVSVPGLVDIRGVYGQAATYSFRATFLVAGPAGRGRVLDFYLPTYSAMEDTEAVVTQVDQPVGGEAVGMTNNTYTAANFALARSAPLPGDFQFFPCAIPQLGAIAFAGSTARRWAIPCADGAFWTYYEPQASDGSLLPPGNANAHPPYPYCPGGVTPKPNPGEGSFEWIPTAYESVFGTSADARVGLLTDGTESGVIGVDFNSDVSNDPITTLTVTSPASITTQASLAASSYWVPIGISPDHNTLLVSAPPTSLVSYTKSGASWNLLTSASKPSVSVAQVLNATINCFAPANADSLFRMPVGNFTVGAYIDLVTVPGYADGERYTGASDGRVLRESVDGTDKILWFKPDGSFANFSSGMGAALTQVLATQDGSRIAAIRNRDVRVLTDTGSLIAAFSLPAGTDGVIAIHPTLDLLFTKYDTFAGVKIYDFTGTQIGTITAPAGHNAPQISTPCTIQLAFQGTIVLTGYQYQNPVVRHTTVAYADLDP